ncbi:MAG TPA: hypothetical protein VFS05_03600 [Gemmatimonadaceae bacterium]|nr:hypothetical protein [Gemmatimonadaceae bacterium]
MQTLLTHPARSRRVRRLLTTAAIPMALFGLGACDDDDSTGPDGAEGTYALQEVDDESVPASFTITTGQGAELFEMTFNGGSVQIRSGDRYQASFNVVVDGTPATVTDQGDVSIGGGTIVFASDDGDVLTGTIDGSDITIPEVPIDIDDDGNDDLSFKFDLRRQ